MANRVAVGPDWRRQLASTAGQCRSLVVPFPHLPLGPLLLPRARRYPHQCVRRQPPAHHRTYRHCRLDSAAPHSPKLASAERDLRHGASLTDYLALLILLVVVVAVVVAAAVAAALDAVPLLLQPPVAERH